VKWFVGDAGEERDKRAEVVGTFWPAVERRVAVEGVPTPVTLLKLA
jgi:hypothetical protein